MSQKNTNSILFNTVTIAALGFIGLTFAAPTQAQITDQNFEGLKVGVELGWEDRKIDEALLSSPNDFRLTDETDNFVYAGFVGYDKQIDNFVIGAEIEYQPDGTALTANIAGVGTVEVESSWSASLSTRAGVVVTPNLLAYGRLGYRLNRYTAKITPVNASVPTISVRSNANGVVYGGGLEYAVKKNFSLRAEYRQTDFSAFLSSSQILAGASLRF